MFMVLGLAVGSATTAEAKKAERKRVERTVEASYAPPFVAPVTGCQSLLGPFACLIIETRPTEAFFTAKVTDAHGQPVYFEVSGGGQNFRGFCGETPGPISFEPGDSLEFDIGLPRWGVQVDCPASSIKTTGTISVRLSNGP